MAPLFTDGHPCTTPEPYGFSVEGGRGHSGRGGGSGGGIGGGGGGDRGEGIGSFDRTHFDGSFLQQSLPQQVCNSRHQSLPGLTRQPDLTRHRGLIRQTSPRRMLQQQQQQETQHGEATSAQLADSTGWHRGLARLTGLTSPMESQQPCDDESAASPEIADSSRHRSLPVRSLLEQRQQQLWTREDHQLPHQHPHQLPYQHPHQTEQQQQLRESFAQEQWAARGQNLLRNEQQQQVQQPQGELMQQQSRNPESSDPIDWWTQRDDLRQLVPAGSQAAAVSHGCKIFNIPLSYPSQTLQLSDSPTAYSLETSQQMDLLPSWEASTAAHASHQHARQLAQENLNKTWPVVRQPDGLTFASDACVTGQGPIDPVEWAGPSDPGQMKMAQSLPLPVPWEESPRHDATKDWSRCQLSLPPTCQQLPSGSASHFRAGSQQQQLPGQQGRSKRGRTLAPERQNFLGPPPRPPTGTCRSLTPAIYISGRLYE